MDLLPHTWKEWLGLAFEALGFAIGVAAALARSGPAKPGEAA